MTFSSLLHIFSRPLPQIDGDAAFKVWRRIASFISLREFRAAKLYTLNRPFLHFYLEKQYSRLLLTYVYKDKPLKNHPLFRQLEHSCNSLAISRVVRHIRISILRYNKAGDIEKGSPGVAAADTPAKRSSQERGPEISDAEHEDQFIAKEDIVNTLSQLQSLTSITLCWTFPPPELDTITPNIPVYSSIVGSLPLVWSSCQNTLTMLTLSFRPRYLCLGLPALRFPNLQDFEFELSVLTIDPPLWPPRLDDPDFPNIKRNLIEFLLNHKQTLRGLGLALPSCRFSKDLLDEIPYLQYLIRLSLSFPMFQCAVLSSIVSFIKPYSQVIRQFSFRLRSFPYIGNINRLKEWMSTHWKAIVLPSVDNISLSFHLALPFKLEATYLATLRSNIRTLALGSPSLTSENVQELLVALVNSGTHERLENILFCPSSLTPGILHSIAEHLPGLRTLCIKYNTIAKHRDHDKGYNKPSYAQFSRLDLSNWCLEKLFLIRTVGKWDLERDGDVSAFISAIVQALPQVKQFNGLEPEEDWVDEEVDMLDTPFSQESFPSISWGK
ncbi:hypothetical protein NP233_g3742 [Leucocoprinus birnbaumii]|uniref:Uncharacterized protein n=1 Tax=Leucocoprinus birnbaumii TaxID=56174 RepID=A0AAD5VVY3_9AGAR|nr:hypothetical protein NP233_g3742 [Leucocoprinus birnbaumii]